LHKVYLERNALAHLEVSELSESTIASIKAANLLSIVTHRGENKYNKKRTKKLPQTSEEKQECNPKTGPSRSRNSKAVEGQLLFGRNGGPEESTMPMQVQQ
jgi:hypothetical protein